MNVCKRLFAPKNKMDEWQRHIKWDYHYLNNVFQCIKLEVERVSRLVCGSVCMQTRNDKRAHTHARGRKKSQNQKSFLSE